MKNNKGMSGAKMAAIGAGMAGVAAGAYYLMGPKGKAHQQKAKALLAKMQKEVKSEIKKAKEVSTPVYHKAVDIISKNYAKQYKMHEKEIKAFANKLKSEVKSASGVVKKSIKTLKKKSK